MDLAQRDFSNPYICKLLFDTSGEAFPMANANVLQNFYDSTFPDTQNFEAVYYSKGKVSFSENGEKTRAGMMYEQKLEFGFPSGDGQRSRRFEELLRTKYIGIVLTNNKMILLGRNDWKQNTAPNLKIKTDQKSVVVSFSQRTMFACGYSALSGISGFPYLLPSTT